MELISVNAVSKSYVDARKVLGVLSEITLSIKRGEVVALMGESGAGKTTLLNLLGLLDVPDNGFIEFDGSNILHLTADERATFRNGKIGFLFQSHHLLSDFSALENVMMPGLIGRSSWGSLAPKAANLLSLVGLSDRLNHLPAELSGGEQQRVAMARALMNDPLLVLADEPTGNLDEANANHFMDIALDMVKKTERSFLIATHSSQIAHRCDRILRLAHGRIEGD